jgi:hypothetical protein
MFLAVSRDSRRAVVGAYDDQLLGYAVLTGMPSHLDNQSCGPS